MSPIFSLSPSDFAFLWEECKRCFYLKCVRHDPRPFGAFPGIFSVIDSRMKDFFKDKRLDEVVVGAPPCRVAYQDRWAVSAPLSLPGHSAQVILRGKYDSVVEFEDGGYGVIDFKTTFAKEKHLQIYNRQLCAYAYALEHPSPEGQSLQPVKQTALLVFDPAHFKANADGRAALYGRSVWVDLPLDEEGFLQFLGSVLDILELPEPPHPDPQCPWCKYRTDS